ncbi:ABC transporter ATP-binding protein [Planotetraspora phitsanulokensis]|uniref:Multidrug ABC transporter ATP-binding protein n=1 Tax=Planotetraspora phitsanulokensis TaxID=575192 RepID=A0A8J3U8X8_9ACTN|nr:ABC transporter ATP-binding protein [Planotetraspora phitsanulokensis]GII40808.1 multidrug ABC transporter ATP-binding protein [Planotetraspora phitsanulokensis]
MDTVISVRGLRMSYGERQVLRGLDLDLRRGETVALLGPNGAGKTTTIEILQGLRTRAAGDVEVLGEDPARGADAWRARLGTVLQDWHDHPRWQVRTLLDHVAAHYPAPWDTDELLRTLGLEGHATARVRELSGGQRRRLDVGLGIVGRPELLFLDEPTTGFDPEARREFHELIESLDITILLTTHDLAEAERLADRVAVLLDGRIAIFGTPKEVAAAVQAPSLVRWRDGCERTDDPSGLAWRLHQRYGGPVPELEIRRPTLEESYLNLVERSAA